MARNYFDTRRGHAPNIGLPRDLLDSAVLDDALCALRDESATRTLIESDLTPVPATEDRENYFGERHLEYWLSGLADWRKLKVHVAVAPPAPGSEGSLRRYLDLGGATGRVVRHAARDPALECWLTDINVNWIDWLTKYFAYPLHAFQARLIPHLPLEDRYFSIVSAYSVFTHLDTEELPWLLELRRILLPGGLLYLTILDEGVWNLLRDPAWAWLCASLSRGNQDSVFADLVRAPMAGDRAVWQYSDADLYNVNVFLRKDYVFATWSKFFEIVAYEPMAHNYQTVVILRKRD